MGAKIAKKRGGNRGITKSNKKHGRARRIERGTWPAWCTYSAVAEEGPNERVRAGRVERISALRPAVDRLSTGGSYLPCSAWPAANSGHIPRVGVRKTHQRAVDVRWPELAQNEIDRTWGGIMAVTRNGGALFGEVGDGGMHL